MPNTLPQLCTESISSMSDAQDTQGSQDEQGLETLSELDITIQQFMENGTFYRL